MDFGAQFLTSRPVIYCLFCQEYMLHALDLLKNSEFDLTFRINFLLLNFVYVFRKHSLNVLDPSETSLKCDLKVA